MGLAMLVKNSHGIFVNPSDNPSRLLVKWKDYREHPRELWFNKLDHEISHVEIDGVRYIRAPKYEESCEVLD